MGDFMKKLVCLLAMLGLNSAFAENVFDYICTDGKVTVEYTFNGEVPEVGDSNYDVFKNKNTLRVTYGDKSFTYTEFIGMATDGFGNDLVQVYVPGGFYTLLEKVADFTYEHEGGYLSGFVKVEGEDYHLDEEFACKVLLWD